MPRLTLEKRLRQVLGQLVTIRRIATETEIGVRAALKAQTETRRTLATSRKVAPQDGAQEPSRE